MLGSRAAWNKALVTLFTTVATVVKLAAMFVFFLYLIPVLPVVVSVFFPRLNEVVLWVLIAVSLLLSGFVVCRMTFAFAGRPWYDTVVALVFIAWQAYGYRHHAWGRHDAFESTVIEATGVLVLNAVLAWVREVIVRARRAASPTG